MSRWKASVRRTSWAIITSVALSIFAGYMGTLTAQESARQSVQTQLAVTQNQVANLQLSQVQVTSEINEMNAKLSNMSDRLSNMQGIGTGAICLLGVLNTIGIVFTMKSQKPGA